MSLTLATRGYLLPNFGALAQFGPGPTIVGTEEIKPLVLGAKLEQEEGPTITGGATQAPRISGGASSTPPSPSDGPTITGGGVQAPDIDGSKES